MLAKPNRKALRIVGGEQQIEEPTFSASAGDKAVIKNFLDFALKDLKFQFDGLRRELGSPTTAGYAAKAEDLQAHAVIIKRYVEALREGVDHMELVN